MPKQTWRNSATTAFLLIAVSLTAPVTARLESVIPVQVTVQLDPAILTPVSAQGSPDSHLRPGHKAVVEKWLKLRADLRLATEADNTNKEGLAGTRRDRGQSYQPYYAVGDFNGDRKEDFAIALVKKKRSQWRFVFAIFNGPVARATKPTFTADADLADGGIFYNPQNSPGQFRLAYGAFESDDCVILRPRRRSYVANPCLE